ncbi:MAG: radical SAM protein [Planctomycetota bacterium]|nr:radical SAM protein [Planctomycetota bacterium]
MDRQEAAGLGKPVSPDPTAAIEQEVSMELPRRTTDDVYLPDGTFTAAIEGLRRRTDAHSLRIAIVYAFDFRTRMLPYWYADKRMAPCSVRTLGDCLHAAGFKHVRIVLQQWTPNFNPSAAVLDGRPLDLLMVSAMQVHADPSYDLIRDTHTLGDARPLILAGGPKAIYEPTDYFELGPRPGIGADCVSTGEAFVFLNLLETILDTPGKTVRSAFERARREGALDKVPGLVYLAPDAPDDRPVAINTGVQRLLRDLDEMPMPDAGYRLLEPPHRRKTLAPRPYPPKKVGRKSIIASVITTQGCKFNCSYCPIPAVNQRTWRYKSPKRIAAEIKHIHENFGIKEFFSTDDNFFNTRETVVDLMTEMARTKIGGVPMAQRISFFTEATEFDVYKNLDILPLCRAGGLKAIWFGIEDITADLVNKGQTAGKTRDVFARLHDLDIQTMSMMIHSDDQPVRSSPGDLSGLLNQARYLFNQGAVSYQCTYLGPAVGTRDFEPAARSRTLYKTVAGEPIPQAFLDGNHVAASGHPRPWDRQINVLRAYATFYNPWNTVRVLASFTRDSLGAKRLLFQIIGQIGLLMTAPRLFAWARKLRKGPIEVWDGLQAARIPMIDAASGRQTNWAIEHLPTPDLPPIRRPRKDPSDPTPDAELVKIA